MTLFLCALSLQNLYSGTYQMGLGVFKRQIIWFVLGFFLCFSFSLVDFKFFERYANQIYIVVVILLVAVLFVGKSISGSKSWIPIGDLVTFQPSEFAKLAIIFGLAKFYNVYNDFDESLRLRELIKPILIAGVPMGLVLLQPDLGTFMMLALIAGSIILFMGVKTRSLLFLFFSLAAGLIPIWKFFLKTYQKERILTFLDPSRDPLGAGYNAIQSQIAVGSGKLFGKGFLQGSQTQLSFIPEQNTDFVFSIVAEEWGFFGASLTLVLYFILILWSLDTASRAKDKFTGIVSFGIAAMIFWHVFVNVGMVTGILPVTGVPLMLSSYGGSSTITVLIGIGMVLGIRIKAIRPSR